MCQKRTHRALPGFKDRVLNDFVENKNTLAFSAETCYDMGVHAAYFPFALPITVANQNCQ